MEIKISGREEGDKSRSARWENEITPTTKIYQYLHCNESILTTSISKNEMILLQEVRQFGQWQMNE